MNQSIIQKTSIKRNILTGVHIECEPSASVTRYCSSVEREAKALESWAQEIKDFIRDHRSMDSIYLEVVREYSDLCDLCKSPWEEMRQRWECVLGYNALTAFFYTNKP